MLPNPDWKAEEELWNQGGNNNDDNNQGGDMPGWMLKKESNRGDTKNRDSKKRPAQIKKNNNHATQDVKIQKGTTEGRAEGSGEEE